MIEAFITANKPRRLVCLNESTYRLLWPLFFTSAVPAARGMCRWASRNGARVSGAVRLQYDEKRMCHLIVTREVEINRCLISIPLRLIMSTDMETMQDYVTLTNRNANVSTCNTLPSIFSSTSASCTHNSYSELLEDEVYHQSNTNCNTNNYNEMQRPVCEPTFTHTASLNSVQFWEEMEKLTLLLIRELSNRRSLHRHYVELLHDLYNCDNDEQMEETSWVKEEEQFEFISAGEEKMKINMYDNIRPNYANKREHRWLCKQNRLMKELEMMYGGNVFMARGVLNVPFMNKETLHTPEQRLAWVRAHELIRRVQQSVPYFSVSLVPWALSMVLSRAMNIASACISAVNESTIHRKPEQHNGKPPMPPVLWGLCPLIDFCSHSYTPTATLHITRSTKTHYRYKYNPLLNSCNNSNSDVSNTNRDSSSEPCVQLITCRHLQRGDELTLSYSSRLIESVDDVEYWRMRWGFVPRIRKSKMENKLRKRYIENIV